VPEEPQRYFGEAPRWSTSVGNSGTGWPSQSTC